MAITIKRIKYSEDDIAKGLKNMQNLIAENIHLTDDYKQKVRELTVDDVEVDYHYSVSVSRTYHSAVITYSRKVDYEYTKGYKGEVASDNTIKITKETDYDSYIDTNTTRINVNQTFSLYGFINASDNGNKKIILSKEASEKKEFERYNSSAQEEGYQSLPDLNIQYDNEFTSLFKKFVKKGKDIGLGSYKKEINKIEEPKYSDKITYVKIPIIKIKGMPELIYNLRSKVNEIQWSIVPKVLKSVKVCEIARKTQSIQEVMMAIFLYGGLLAIFAATLVYGGLIIIETWKIGGVYSGFMYSGIINIIFWFILNIISLGLYCVVYYFVIGFAYLSIKDFGGVHSMTLKLVEQNKKNISIKILVSMLMIIGFILAATLAVFLCIYLMGIVKTWFYTDDLGGMYNVLKPVMPALSGIVEFFEKITSIFK